MGINEIAYRTSNAVKARVERLGYGRVRPENPMGNSGRPIGGNTIPPVEPSAYIMAAERILAGYFRIFALDSRLGFPPDWNRDPKTLRHSPMVFGKSINYRDEKIVGDIKYLWEPNRHLQLVTLAQAWVLTRDSRFSDGCKCIIESWIAQNPYLYGVNWTSSLEHSIRLTNWSFAWGLLGGDASPLFEGEAGCEFRTRWLNSVREHQHFIVNHLSKFSSANNHLLGEYLGVLVASTTWPMWSESVAWGRMAKDGFEREVLKQNTQDGVNREQAVYYQHEVMDMMLIAGLLLRANGSDFGQAYWEQLERLCDFIASIMDVTGQVPMIGDSDDALIMRLNPKGDFDPYKPLLAAGAMLFNRPDLGAKATKLDDKTMWLFPEGKLLEQGPVTAQLLPTLEFGEGGYQVLGDRFDTDEELRLVFDCGPLGYLSIAAHGHADALSFTLSAYGTEWLIDPGTYAYHTDQEWRNHFRGTGAHNCVRIDGLDQSVIGGAFLWLQKANSHLLEVGQLYVTGEHDGYERLADPVRHRRHIEIDPLTDTILVKDTLLCNGPHDVDISWQFGEECAVHLAAEGVTASAKGKDLSLTCDQSRFVLSLLAGNEAPIGGWVSRRFDEKVPATMARWSGKIEGTTEIMTILRFGK